MVWWATKGEEKQGDGDTERGRMKEQNKQESVIWQLTFSMRISRIAIFLMRGSSSDSTNFLMATSCVVSLLRHLNTTPYEPSPIFPIFSYFSILSTLSPPPPPPPVGTGTPALALGGCPGCGSFLGLQQQQHMIRFSRQNVKGRDVAM